MKKRNTAFILAAALTIGVTGGMLSGCGSSPTATASSAKSETQDKKEGGLLTLKINPEIDIAYNNEGNVTNVDGQNDDGDKIAAEYIDYAGKDCQEVVSDLVAKIDEAGYFTANADGTPKEITLEIEKGSVLPEENFLKNIVAGIQEYTSSKQLAAPVNVNGESNYGWTNYGDTDYGPDNDGVTDYSAPAETPAASGTSPAAGDTDYGAGSDGVTDYGDTDYGAGSDGVTDYGDTDYGAGSDGVTDYSAPAPAAPAGGDSGYDSGDSGYDD